MTRSWQQSLKRALCAKVRSNRGETLTEVLVSIVISGLAILMLGMAISAATSANLHSKDEMDKYYKESNDIATLSTTGEPRSGSVELKTKDNEPVYLDGDKESADARFYIEQEGAGSEDGETPVATYIVDRNTP